MDLVDAMRVSAAGMKAQGKRLKVIAENLANANSMAPVPGGEPYRRKVVTFENVLDKEIDSNLVRVRDVTFDKSEFRKNYDPNHPAAGDDGYVKMPNVNTLVEMMDMREVQRSYEANLRIIDVSRKLVGKTVELLR